MSIDNKLTMALRKSMNQDFSNNNNNDKSEKNTTLHNIPFNYVSIEASDNGLRLISVNSNLDILKQNTLNYIKQNSKLTYQYVLKKGVLKVLYRSNLMYTYKILYLSDDTAKSDEPNEPEHLTPIFGTIPFTTKDLEEDEEGDSHFNN